MREPPLTAWRGMDLLVLRGTEEIDRVPAGEIDRVILAYHRAGETPGDLAYALIDTPTHTLLLPPATGIAGRVHFERQAFWAQRPCVYWVPATRAPLPRALRGGWWLLSRRAPSYQRVPRTEVQAEIDRWPLEGPQSWEQRKWERIVRSRLLQPWTRP
ncbi:hypothetical protein V4F39_11090 [Aquincola sp. MAHUQ-54]|uniref:Uncharacterized protein n=1 Tax=Aquincola agrisoli TaxID=3119538 RepID=A0AAW9Q5A7_9BURK